MTNNLPPGWKWEVWQDGTQAYVYDPAIAQLQAAPCRTSGPDLKGELGRLYGPMLLHANNDFPSDRRKPIE